MGVFKENSGLKREFFEKIAKIHTQSVNFLNFRRKFTEFNADFVNFLKFTSKIHAQSVNLL